MGPINYEINKADSSAIAKHLYKCSSSFTPPLETYVDIPRYAEKLEKNAVTFEAWHDDELVALIACYLNNKENKVGFISNVSTVPFFQGKRISAKLFQDLLNYTKGENFHSFSLEVNKLNTQAISFYKKMGFRIKTTLSTKEVYHMCYRTNASNNE